MPLLRVTGRTFCAGLVIERVQGEWRVTDCAPYLRRIVAGIPSEKIGEELARKGLKWEWVPARVQTGQDGVA